MQQFTEAQIEEMNKRTLEIAAKEFEEFKTDLEKGVCHVCKQPLKSFDEQSPCLHWLLMLEGFRKKHFKKVFDMYTYLQIESMLRWHANANTPFKNINDLKEEHFGDKVKAFTIKMGNIEWSFDFSKNCVEGRHGVHGPHYHFQAKLNDRVVHSYGSRHITLGESERFALDVEQGKIPQFVKKDPYGMGMQSMVDDVDTEALLDSMRVTDDIDNATYDIESLVLADDGHEISGDDIADIIEESRRTGVPMHRLIKRLQNVKTRIVVQPGQGVPQPAQRTPVRPGKKKTGPK